MLCDLDDQAFEQAIMDIAKNTQELYPNTNLVAIIRAKAEEIHRESRRKSDKLLTKETEQERLDRWKREAVPMPDEAREILKKHGIGRD